MRTETKEIIWNIINCILAGSLVMLGNLSTGKFTIEGLYFASIAAFIVAIVQFKNFWDTEKPEYCSPKLFSFVKL